MVAWDSGVLGWVWGGVQGGGAHDHAHTVVHAHAAHVPRPWTPPPAPAKPPQGSAPGLPAPRLTPHLPYPPQPSPTRWRAAARRTRTAGGHTLARCRPHGRVEPPTRPQPAARRRGRPCCTRVRARPAPPHPTERHLTSPRPTGGAPTTEHPAPRGRPAPAHRVLGEASSAVGLGGLGREPFLSLCSPPHAPNPCAAGALEGQDLKRRRTCTHHHPPMQTRASRRGAPLSRPRSAGRGWRRGTWWCSWPRWVQGSGSRAQGSEHLQPFV